MTRVADGQEMARLGQARADAGDGPGPGRDSWLVVEYAVASMGQGGAGPNSHGPLMDELGGSQRMERCACAHAEEQAAPLLARRWERAYEICG